MSKLYDLVGFIYRESLFSQAEAVLVIFTTANSHAAFAFVKFNNTESPARAVFEEVCYLNVFGIRTLCHIVSAQPRL